MGYLSPTSGINKQINKTHIIMKRAFQIMIAAASTSFFISCESADEATITPDVVIDSTVVVDNTDVPVVADPTIVDTLTTVVDSASALVEDANDLIDSGEELMDNINETITSEGGN